MGRSFAVKAIHKQMYPATYNFRDEVNGTSGTDIDGIGASSFDTVEVESDYLGHKKIIHFTSAGAGTFRSEFTPQTDENVEGWLNNAMADNFYFNIANESLQDCCTIRYTSKTNIRIYSGDGIGGNNETNVTVVEDAWVRVRVYFSCTTNKYSVWIDGVLKLDDQNFTLDRTATTIKRWAIYSAGACEGFFDALGFGWDANYNVGDNCFWRHYKESEADTFEENDVGTQGTSITWVDWVDTAASFEIIGEFGIHKKVLRGYYSSAVGVYDEAYHTFATQAKTGWFAAWIKTSDATIENVISLREDGTTIVSFQIDGDKFQVHTGGAWRDVTGAPIPADDTWYLIYIQWYDAATDTFDLWIDNVQYEDGTNCYSNQTSGVNRCYTLCFSATEYLYLDAPISSLDGDERGDNRIFDYNATYTAEDITADVINVKYSNSIYKWREATMSSRVAYENSEIFLQIYDVNSALAMEAEIKNRAQVREIRTYSLRDKNWDDLNNRSSNTFTTAKIHDPTDATSMLKVILPNVGEVDGDLLLVEADTKATTYSPTTKNYPDYEMLRDIADLADSCVIVHANGKVYLDDDKASGTTLDKDTAAHADMMTAAPLITDILETINYFEIFGAINPDTGTRFTKVIDNSGTDKKRKWRYTNNEFRTQTDVDNYATALSNRITTIKIIKFTAQSLGAHNMGETINYKFVDALYNVPQANYYVIFEEIDFDKNLNTIILSEGMIEDSKYSAAYERPENYNDSYASEIYETDINTLYPDMKIYLGSTAGTGSVTGYHGIVCNAVNEGVLSYIYLDDMVDIGRDIVITWIFTREDNNQDTIQAYRWISKRPVDGSGVWADVELGTVYLDACLPWRTKTYVYTIDSSDLTSEYEYRLILRISEANREIVFTSTTIRYYIKRGL